MITDRSLNTESVLRLILFFESLDFFGLLPVNINQPACTTDARRQKCEYGNPELSIQLRHHVMDLDDVAVDQSRWTTSGDVV